MDRKVKEGNNVPVVLIIVRFCRHALCLPAGRQALPACLQVRSRANCVGECAMQCVGSLLLGSGFLNTLKFRFT